MVLSVRRDGGAVIRKLLFSIVFVLLISNIGCTMYAINENSIPSLADDKASTVIEESPIDCTLQLSDINISIVPRNSTGKFLSVGVCLPIIPIIFPCYPEAENNDPLIVNVILAPKSGIFTFEPMKVKLIMNDLIYTPTSYKGPLSISGGITDCDYRYREYNNDPYAVLDIPLEIKSSACIELKFPIETSDIKKEFSFELLGIKKDGQNYHIPKLIFRRGHQSEFLLLG